MTEDVPMLPVEEEAPANEVLEGQNRSIEGRLDMLQVKVDKILQAIGEMQDDINELMKKVK